MKESMTVAKTLAWSLCDEKTCINNVKKYDETKSQILHSLSRGSKLLDGPSAGTDTFTENTQFIK